MHIAWYQCISQPPCNICLAECTASRCTLDTTSLTSSLMHEKFFFLPGFNRRPLFCINFIFSFLHLQIAWRTCVWGVGAAESAMPAGLCVCQPPCPGLHAEQGSRAQWPAGEASLCHRATLLAAIPDCCHIACNTLHYVCSTAYASWLSSWALFATCVRALLQQ